MNKKSKKVEAKSNGKITPEEFVKAWQKHETLDAFAEATGMDPVTAGNRARHYRKLGVELKAYPRRSHARIDVDALNALVK